MKRNRFFTAISLAVALALAACTQDYEMADADAAGDANGEALPEGMYPLQIGSISVSAEGSGEPWTRVAETADGSGSVFTNGDAIGVNLNGNITTYTYDGGTWTPTYPLYWKDTYKATVTAWYPVADKIDFTQQDKGLTYLLKAKTDGASYNTATNLTFTHQLAKVRVVLTGVKASKVADVKIRSYPTADISEGNLSNSSGSAVYCPMRKAIYGYTTCWEANMIPGTLVADKSFQISKSDGTTVNVTLAGDVPIEAGKMHTITIEVKSSAAPDAKEITDIINDDGQYVVSGVRTSAINIMGGQPTIYLDEAEVSVSKGPAINITGGSPTIRVVGENTLENNIGDFSSNYNYSGAGIYVAPGSTVTITGNSNSRTDDVLTVRGGAGGCGIGGYLLADADKDNAQNSGNIMIRDVTIKAYGSYDSEGCCSPAIGAAGNASVERISISNAVVYASGKGTTYHGSAAIGGGMDYQGNVGQRDFNITISNSTIYAERGHSSASYIGAAGAQSGATANYNIISTAIITNSTIYNESGTEITK